MASDITRRIFNKNKSYSGVICQQGRVNIDSDRNALSDINQYRLHTQTVDVIGKCGVPKGTDGFKIISNGNNLELSPGRIYINGLLSELDQKVLIKNLDRPQLIKGDQSSPPYASVHTKLEDGTYVVYMESWQREINYLQDSEIQEKALGEADTTSRLQTVWKVNSKLVETGVNCQANSAIWNQFISPSSGKLEAKTTNANVNVDPCSLQQSGGYRRLENQLYRVEIQQGGDLSKATFKWSRDNGSVEVKIDNFIGNHIIKVNSLGKDDVLGLQVGHWVEIIDHDKSLAKESNGLTKIVNIDPNSLEITVDMDISSIQVSEGIKLRRWDQPSNIPAAGIPLANNFIAIEDGIEVKFSPGSYKIGDYWLIPARTISSSIEWPLGLSKLPLGIKNGFCKLAIVKVTNSVIESVEDCRPTFPSLTDLCKTTGKCCTYHVSPKAGWESVFDKIGIDEDAMICFEVGHYVLDQTKVISNKGKLRLVGSGPGTKIEALKNQVALRFSDCKYVEISHLSALTGKVANPDKKDNVSLKGTFTFVDVGHVQITDLKLRCGHGIRPQASCINVFNSKAKSGILNVQNSILEIGYFQHGIIVVNSKRTLIENNIISAIKKPKKYGLVNRFVDSRTRAAIKKIMVSNVSAKSNSNTNITIKHKRHSISFKTDPKLKVENVWEREMASDPPVGISNKKDLEAYVINKSSDVMLRPDLIANSAFSGFLNNLKRQDPALAYQGITIGGERATDVHIIRNKIQNVLQGIHAGLSHSAPRNIHDVIKSIKIEKNSICNMLTPVTHYGRHGIFVGNCDSLVIDDNEIELKRLSSAEKIKIDGIRVWGILGKKLNISNNHIFGTNGQSKGYNVGIHVKSLKTTKNTKWGIIWNVAPCKDKTLKLPSTIFQKYLDTNSP